MKSPRITITVNLFPHLKCNISVESMPSPPLLSPWKKHKDRREGKGRRCYLGDVIEYRTYHLAARMIFNQSFW